MSSTTSSNTPSTLFPSFAFMLCLIAGLGFGLALVSLILPQGEKTEAAQPYVSVGPVWKSSSVTATVSGFRDSPGFGRFVDCALGSRSMIALEYPGEKLVLGDPVEFVVLQWDPIAAPKAASYYAKKK